MDFFSNEIVTSIVGAVSAITASVGTYLVAKRNAKKDIFVTDRQLLSQEQQQLRAELRADIKELRDDINAWKVRYKMLEEEVRILREQNKALEEEIRHLVERNLELEAENLQLVVRITQLEFELGRMGKGGESNA